MSRFVPAGTSDTSAQKDEEWLKAQEDLEESKLRKEEEGRQEGGKTLFEVPANSYHCWLLHNANDTFNRFYKPTKVW